MQAYLNLINLSDIGLPTSNESNDDDKATATLIETLDLLESDQNSSTSRRLNDD